MLLQPAGIGPLWADHSNNSEFMYCLPVICHVMYNVMLYQRMSQVPLIAFLLINQLNTNNE